MKKKKLAVFCICMLMFALTACGNKDEESLDSSREARSSNKDKDEKNSKNDVSDNQAVAVSDNEATDNKDKESLDELTPALVIDDVIICIGDDMSFLEEGKVRCDEWANVYDPTADYTDKCFVFGETYIYTREIDQKDIIYLIQVGSEDKLLSGIKIGDSKELLYEKYGDNIHDEGDYLEYIRDDIALDIELIDDVITYMEIAYE